MLVSCSSVQHLSNNLTGIHRDFRNTAYVKFNVGKVPTTRRRKQHTSFYFAIWPVDKYIDKKVNRLFQLSYQNEGYAASKPWRRGSPGKAGLPNYAALSLVRLDDGSLHT